MRNLLLFILMFVCAESIAQTCDVGCYVMASEGSALHSLLPKPHKAVATGGLYEGSTESQDVSIVSDEELGTFDYQLYGFPNEGYRLSVTSDGISITAASRVGVIRALQTLRQLKENSVKGIECCEIEDFPAFKLRGFMHDVGRSFIDIDELKKEIDLLARFKVNVFHWHLTENQAFRFESKRYPQLSAQENMTRFPGMYYTQEECRELEAYANERGMTVIPEIDMPGHSQAFTTAMGFSMNSQEGRIVLKDILKEVAEAFPLAPYIHIGADEAGASVEFVNEMSQFIFQNLGKRVIVWNPIGVSMSKEALPYVGMTQMWSTAGKKMDGVPNIDCRYNYANHFDVFADVVGIYKSQVYYAQHGSPDIAGAITAIWNDRKSPDQKAIIAQNNLYANALATCERAWMGGGKQYIEEGGVMLPNEGEEFDVFADWERRFLLYKDSWLKGEPIPYVKQTDMKWQITRLNSNEPPVTVTGAGIYLRHTWGKTVPALFDDARYGDTVIATTYVYSPRRQTVGALIELQNYSRSEKDLAPEQGCWDRKGSRLWINDKEIFPPVWTNAGREIDNEVELGNENFTMRPPLRIRLRKGWNEVRFLLPYNELPRNEVRLNKWMFTFKPEI